VGGGLRVQGLRVVVGSDDLFYACKGWVIAELFGYRGLLGWLIRFLVDGVWLGLGSHGKNGR
jgi:hypothetical protein